MTFDTAGGHRFFIFSGKWVTKNTVRKRPKSYDIVCTGYNRIN